MAFDFPSSPADGQTYVPGGGGPTYRWSAANQAWIISSLVTPDAPNDGKAYVRKNLGWTTLVASDAVYSPDPTGNISATNVQAAIQELDREKTGEAPTDGQIYGRRNSGWVVVTSGGGGAGDALSVTFAPSGNISATNVQNALQEVDLEKINKAGDTMTGLLVLSGAPIISNHAATKAYVDAAVAAGGGGSMAVYSMTATTSYTRPGNTTTYSVAAAMSNSTSAPAVLTFTNMVSANGKSCVLEGLIVTSSANPALTLQGELWLFDTSPTPINDNAAFTVTDAEIATVVGKIPFTFDSPGAPATSGNIMAEIEMDKLVTTGASRNLFGLVKVMNAYIPASGEVITFRLKARQTD